MTGALINLTHFSIGEQDGGRIRSAAENAPRNCRVLITAIPFYTNSISDGYGDLLNMADCWVP